MEGKRASVDVPAPRIARIVHDYGSHGDHFILKALPLIVSSRTHQRVPSFPLFTPM